MCAKQERKVFCFVCDSIFPTKSKMLYHVSEIHQVSDDTLQKSVELNKTDNNVVISSNDIRHVSLGLKSNESFVKKYSAVTMYSCDQCNKKFKCEENLSKHLKTKHKNVHNKKDRLNIKCVICEHTCLKKDKMLIHYEKDHGIQIVKENIKFVNIKQFLKWKRDLEQETITKFIKFRNKYFKASTKYFYRCHRDGNFKTSGKQLRQLKSHGSNKINGYCPAKMEVWQYKGMEEVIVKFVKTHVGHAMDIHRINLDEEERRFIATKLSNKMPNKKILHEIQNASNDKNGRLKFVTMKDLYNIKKSYSVTYDNKSSKLENCRIKNWIEEIQGTSNSYIRFFKPIGTILSDQPLLVLQDFILVVITDSQLNKLKQFGNNIVCIDIHHCDDHDYDIISLNVIDEKDLCFPCAFMFCNAVTKSVCMIFFEIVKACLGFALKSRTIMTDIEEIYYGWCSVMFSSPIQLFSLWQLKNKWKKNIESKIHSLIKQQLVFDTLGALVEKRNCTEFEKMLSDVCCSMQADYELETFGSYFESFKSNKKCWAQCYRDIPNINSSILFERLHYSVNFFYNQEDRIGYCDRVVVSLIHFIEQKFLDGDSCHDILKRHETCLKFMPTFSISDDGDSTWTVTCSRKNVSYKITKGTLSCTCRHRCNDCNSCIHAYVCSCDDSYLKMNMCQHIHLICQFIQQLNSNNHLLPVNVESNEVFIYSSLSREEDNMLNELDMSCDDDLENKKLQLLEKLNNLVSSVSSYEEIKVLEEAILEISPILEVMKLRRSVLV